MKKNEHDIFLPALILCFKPAGLYWLITETKSVMVKEVLL